MVSILALSVSDKIEQYGAYAGFAAVVGLAVLSLLYFAQAREVKRLREWAGRAPERAAEVQERVQADAQRRVVATPQAQPQRAAAPAQPAQPGQPATQQPATAAGQAGSAVAPAAAAAATAAGAAAKAAPGAPGAPAAPGPPAVPGVAAPPAPGQPTAAAAGSNGGPVTPTPRPGQPLRVGPAAPATGAPAPPSRDGGRSGGRPIAAIIGAVAGVVVVAVVAGVLFLGGGDDNGAKPAPNTIGSNAASQGDGGTSTTPKGTSSTPLKPNAFTTAVLNGTTTPGLARGVATRLQNAKFRIGNVTNAADQSHSATIIEFAPGHRKEALAVADAIDVGSDAVQALTPGSRAIAGEEAFVVVTVGADQNVSPQQQP